MENKKSLKDSISVAFPCTPSSTKTYYDYFKRYTTTNSHDVATTNNIFASFLRCLHFITELTLCR